MSTLFGYMAAVIFLFAAATGAAILRGFLKHRKVKVGGALVHGVFALLGLIMLSLSLVWSRGTEQGPGWWGQVALIIFIVVAIGGGTMVYFHVWHRKLPMWLAFVHAAGAVTGVLLLWFALLQRLFVGQ